MSTRESVESLRLELARVREASIAKEAELTTIVANAKSIFDLNLRHERSNIEKEYRGKLEALEQEVEGQKRVVSSKEGIVSELTKKLSTFEEDKVEALRQQRKSVMLATEIANSDLAQSRAAAEKQRYESEKRIRYLDECIGLLNAQLGDTRRRAELLSTEHLEALVVHERTLRDAIELHEADCFSGFLDHVRALSEADMYQRMCDQILLRNVHDLMSVGDGGDKETYPQTKSGTRLSAQSVAQVISGAYRAKLEALYSRLEESENRNRALQSEQTEAAQRYSSLELAFASFQNSVTEQMSSKSTQLQRASELLVRLQGKVFREHAKKISSASTIDELSSTYEAEINTLKGTITDLEATMASMHSDSTVKSLAAQLSTANQVIGVLRRELLGEKPALPADTSVAVNDPNSSLTAQKGDSHAQEESPFSRWESPKDTTALIPKPSSGGVEVEPSGAMSAEHQQALTLVETLRKELSSTKSSNTDLKALVRKLRDGGRPRTPMDNESPTTPLSDEQLLRPHSRITRETARAETEVKSSTPTRVSSQGGVRSVQNDSELQMQLFTLKRERDAWKRKADAALAQASHAEEQRLASVHTYLQLVGRKEEEYAQHILTGAPVGYTQKIARDVPLSSKDDDVLMPGGSTRSGLDRTALAGVMLDVRARGEERAERWLAVRADELKAQAMQLNQLREELAMKASSLARREEALQHEKMGLMLKKGGGPRPGGLASLLVPRRESETFQEPLRETAPATRLRPVLQVPVPVNETKAHHPQRFVLAPLSQK